MLSYPKAGFAFLCGIIGKLPLFQCEVIRDKAALYETKEHLRKNKKNVGHSFKEKVFVLSFLKFSICRFNVPAGENLTAEHFFLNRSIKDIQYLLKLCSKKININKNSLIFDPGCGTGRHLFYLVDKFGCKGIGVDVYPPAIAVAERANWDRRIKFYSLSSIAEGVLEGVIPDGCDYIFINSLLNHVYGYDGYDEFIKKIISSCRMILVITSIKNDLDKYLPNPDIIEHKIRGKSQYVLIKGNKY